MSRKKRPLYKRVASQAQRAFFSGLIDGFLPALSNVGSRLSHVHHRHIRYIEHAGVPMYLDVYGPEEPGPHPVLVSFHGGGWTMGVRQNIQRAGMHLARKGFVVFNCSYRLAPSHQLPAGMNDAAHALRWVYEHAKDFGGDAQRIGVFGDSAGGHLSAMLAVAQHVPEANPQCPRTANGQVPIMAAVHYYGVFDFPRFGRMRSSIVKAMMGEILGEHKHDEALLNALSPIVQARRGHVPPTLLLVGKRDPLFGQSRRYAERLEKLGADVTLRSYAQGVHGFINLWWSGEYRDSLYRATQHFTKHLKPLVGRVAA